MSKMSSTTDKLSLHYLELSPTPIRFQPVSQVNSVFFDESNKHVFTVRSGGATGVTVKGPTDFHQINFRMEDKGSLGAIKFSPDLKVLALQRSPNSVELVNFSGGVPQGQEYTQCCKSKTSKIDCFNWISNTEIIFVTDTGMEFYTVLPERRQLKLIKTFNVNVLWYLFSKPLSMLVISSSPQGNILHTFQFKGQNAVKLPKFEVDLPLTSKSQKQGLQERDCVIGEIYSKAYILVVKHQAKIAGNQIPTEIHLYRVEKESPARKTHILKLNSVGKFSINIIDNLVVVHHQGSRVSALFDVGSGGSSDGYVTTHTPALTPLPIRPYATPESENYAATWLIFQPDVVIDARIGCMWRLILLLEPLATLIPVKSNLIDFLLLRSDAKPAVLSVCQSSVMPATAVSLDVVGGIFDKINSHYQEGISPAEVGKTSEAIHVKFRNTVGQADVYSQVLSPLLECETACAKHTIAVLTEYIRSLNEYHIPVQHFIYELTINTLVHNNCFYQLHQFLQYHVVTDSKQLACLLLSLEGVYPPAYQLALDMLKRLTTANDEIVEVLLSKRQILTAIKFLRSLAGVEPLSSRKFLEAAYITEDKTLFYTVFKFFEQRNVRLRGSPRFIAGEHCEKYVEYFVSIYGSSALGDEIPKLI